MEKKRRISPELDKEQQFRLRLTFFGFFISSIFLALLFRAYYLQVKKRDYFRRLIRNSQERLFSLSPRRGTIFDRNLSPLALDSSVASIALNPRVFRNNWSVKERRYIIERLSNILSLSKKRIQFLVEQDLFFVWLKRHVTERELREVQKLGIDRALYIQEESKRYYPNFTLASNLLGHTDIDGHGLAGIELFFDKLLRGKPQFLRFAHDSKGRRIVPPIPIDFNSTQGANLVLSIDSALQFIAERELSETVRKFSAKRGIAVIMSPKNGDVLAMAVYPNFDPNNYKAYPPSSRNNWAVTAPYEPGSTMKLVTMAAALNERVVNLKERIDCENGRLRIGRYVIRDDHPSKHPLTPEEIIQHSSNICTAKIAFRLGKRRLYRYLRLFGFGDKTGIGLPGESKGILHSPQRWAKISLANISFGQGIAVTPIQLTAAINAVASGGILYRPRLYLKALDFRGKVIRAFRPKPLRRVIESRVARRIAEMMEAVVLKGTGKKAAIPGIRVGGKTGTAQKPRKNGRGYGRERVASFVGFLPVDDPKLTILVVIDEPQKSKYGGTVAAPAWKRIALASLQYLGEFSYSRLADKTYNSLRIDKKYSKKNSKKVEKNRTFTDKIKIPDLLGTSWQEAVYSARKMGFSLITLGSRGKGKVCAQYPPANSEMVAKELTLVFCMR